MNLTNRIIWATLAAGLLAGCGSTAKIAKTTATTTFTNPMLWADVPDPDVTRKGDTFYLMSTTMHLMPGAPVMASKDLVHWEPVSYVFETINETPKYDMKEGTVYGRGQWATSIQYHDGMFWVYFSPNDEPWRSFIYKTTDPAKGWQLHSRMRHFHDGDLFFDDDGRVYIFYGTGELCELEPDLSGVKEGGINQKIFERDAEETGLLEGSRVVKHNGKYYLIMISSPGGKPRRQLCYRADKITGPYEKKIILEDNFAGFPYAAQGGIVDDEAGNWYGIIFQDRGAVGRVPLMIPVRWVDDWPMLSDENGKVPLTGQVPFAPHDTGRRIVESDDFNSPDMSIVWQWNHNPINEAWSLTERPGHLRLKTSRVVENLFMAPNTITQRMEGPGCTGIVALDLKNMRDGDAAGLSAFNGDAGVLTVHNQGGKKTLVMAGQHVALDNRTKAVTDVRIEEQGRVELSGDKIWLRVDGDFRLRRDMATFFYSLDGENWTPIGGEFKMRFDYRRHFMGSKFAIFNYATKENGGYVDVDNFQYRRE
jgi:beta-xylosidase